MLRKQVDTSNDYRILIAKQQVEIAVRNLNLFFNLIKEKSKQ